MKKLWMFIFFAFSVKAETLLITGATGAFGEALSFHFASKKYDLILAARNQTKLDDLKIRLLKHCPNLTISTLRIDFSKIAEIQASIQQKKINFLDGVVLIGPRPELRKDAIPSAKEWQNALRETFIGPLEFLRQVIPHVRDGGSIVIMAGNSSKEYLRAYPNTNVIRLAWIGEMKNIMHFLAPRKIRVNGVSPGPILTLFHRDKIAQAASENKLTFDEQFKRYAQSIPLGTYGSLKDVANLVYFLISEKSKHINGANVVLDGGESNAY